MDSALVISIGIPLGVGATLLLATYGFWQLIKAIRGTDLDENNVTLDAVLDALEKYVRDGIDAAFITTLRAFDTFELWLESADKAAVANSMYDLIPDVVMVGSIPIPVALVKRLVSRDEFEVMVKDAYDRVNAFVQQNETYFRSKVQEVLDEIPAQ